MTTDPQAPPEARCNVCGSPFESAMPNVETPCPGCMDKLKKMRDERLRTGHPTGCDFCEFWADCIPNPTDGGGACLRNILERVKRLEIYQYDAAQEYLKMLDTATKEFNHRVDDGLKLVDRIRRGSDG